MRIPILAALVLSSACAYHAPTAPTPAVTPPSNAVASIRLTSSSRTDQKLDIAAEVLTADGRPLPGQAVAFVVGAGTITPSTATTNDGGFARAVAVTTQPTTVTATDGSVSATVNVSGTVQSLTFYSITASENPIIGQAVLFSASIGGLATRYAWNFGDGASQMTTSYAVSHVYAHVGRYTVSLTASDDHGQHVGGSTSVSVSPVPPEQTPPPTPPTSLAVAMTCTNAALVVSCNVAASYGSPLPSTAITSVSWEWGDGDTAPGTTAPPLGSHTYAQPGTYLIAAKATVTVSGVSPDPKASASQTIKVP